MAYTTFEHRNNKYKKSSNLQAIVHFSQPRWSYNSRLAVIPIQDHDNESSGSGKYYEFDRKHNLKTNVIMIRRFDQFFFSSLWCSALETHSNSIIRVNLTNMKVLCCRKPIKNSGTNGTNHQRRFTMYRKQANMCATRRAWQNPCKTFRWNCRIRQSSIDA